MAECFVADSRGDLIESRHEVAVAVTDATGALVASCGLGDEPVFWRSTAKPFQLWPLVERGGIERWGLDNRHLALACGSHNAEPMHREVAADWLARIGADVDDLSCGPHPSLSPRVAEEMIRERVIPDATWSNCSGKHAAMLALARLEEWPTAGYAGLDHPVQQAVAHAIARWSHLETTALHWGVDGCTAAAVATPLHHLATAWANLGASDDPSLARIRAAMLAHPELVAGTDRLDSLLMQAWAGRILVKVGAEGVFAAALPTLGLGVALKIADGDMRAAGIALAAVLDQLLDRVDAAGVAPRGADAVAQSADPEHSWRGHRSIHGARSVAVHLNG